MTAPPTANEPATIEGYSTNCPDCAGAGYYVLRVPFGHPEFGTLHSCRCKVAERASFRQARAAQILIKLADELGAHATRTFNSFDCRHADRDVAETLTNITAACEVYAAELRGWLYLWGPCGSGKSHLAAAIANAAAAQSIPVSYASAPSLIRFLKAGFEDKSSDRRLLALQTCDLLILDDLGAEYHAQRGGSDYATSILFELLNERSTYSRATVITSNMPVDEHEPRIAARIKRSGRVLFLDADDYATRGRL